MSELAQCVIDCRQCAGLFRLGRDVEAALTMVDVFDKVQDLLCQAPEDIQLQWAQLLMSMLASQEAQDWLGLADTMEYELIDLLDAIHAHL
ncbi:MULTISPECIES: hypothetical protein [Pseudomonas]|uniref:hypothetical protein n=1 Tax=Pseudomonas TaxID=286 RepID=UPI000CD06396|nr:MULTISPECIES: hypothetical protein [unclassified Pseudomonas]POA32601.1 hypothetical protein C1887_08735 [Pseudomonas sp. GW456-R21]POA68232.1 hypothetical protein C1884_10150 [Pseudomonas sp. GW460-R15]